MTRLILALCAVLCLAGVAQAQPAPQQGNLMLVGPAGDRPALILTAGGSPLEGVSDIVRMDAPHLLFLGAGVVGGALFIAPTLGVSEFLGVGLGVIASEYIYRTAYRSRFAIW